MIVNFLEVFVLLYCTFIRGFRVQRASSLQKDLLDFVIESGQELWSPIVSLSKSLHIPKIHDILYIICWRLSIETYSVLIPLLHEEKNKTIAFCTITYPA